MSADMEEDEQPSSRASCIILGCGIAIGLGFIALWYYFEYHFDWPFG